MVKKISVFLVLLVLAVFETETARILAYFPTPSISHQVVFRKLTLELAKRGHELLVITPDPVYPKGKSPENYTEIDVHDISYKNWEEMVVVNNKGDKENLLNQALTILKCLTSTVDLQLQVPEVKAVLKRDKDYFDLLLLESIHRSILGLANVFDAPIVHISSFGIGAFQYGDFGAPTHTILYPTPDRQRLYNLSFIEKCIEYIKYYGFHIVVKITEKYDYDVTQRHFGQDVPSFEELKKKIQMVFVNEYQQWSSNRPVSPNIIFMGGLHLQTQKNLPQDLQLYLDSSKNGVIYVSFGTNVITNMLPQEKIVSMINVFSKLPYNVLWKWDTDELPGKSNNIKIAKWLPQADLLKHPKVKLFITQGGMQSTDETIDAGVPVIGIPMYGDQWYNVEKYAYHNIGIQLDLQTLTEEQFESSIKTVINDASYKNNILKLRGQMMDRPISPLDLAVWWTEHVINYGGDHIQPPSIFMHWYDYYEVKLIVTVLAIVTAILTIISLFLKCVISVFRRKCNFVKLKTH